VAERFLRDRLFADLRHGVAGDATATTRDGDSGKENGAKRRDAAD
jgi:hypothetical protein